jgi:hypothetical protein
VRALLIVVVLCVATRAQAHQTSVKYVDLAVRDERHVALTIRFQPGDVTEPMGLAPDATPAMESVFGHAAVAPFVARWFALGGCTQGPLQLGRVDTAFLALSTELTCASTRALTFDATAFFALDRRHEAIVRLTAPGASAIQTIVRASEPRITLRAGESPSLLAWVGTGMDHIYGGLDHILFVISLLLVVMLVRDGDGWRTRGFVPTLRSTAVVITAFTVAHSITLITAALGLVALPGRLVEALIAASIAYTAAEDVVNPAVRWRFVLTFAFGLVHGLGFAATLAELLPPTDVVVPLLCFNAGVEIGQLTIVAAVLPVLYVVASRLGAGRYRRYALPVLAVPILVVGLAMVVDRVT